MDDMEHLALALSAVATVGVFGAIIGVIYWCTKSFVRKDTCDIVQRSMEKSIDVVARSIVQVETRADARHQDLKKDMQAGFDEIKALINKKNSGE